MTHTGHISETNMQGSVFVEQNLTYQNSLQYKSVELDKIFSFFIIIFLFKKINKFKTKSSSFSMVWKKFYNRIQLQIWTISVEFQ